MQHRRCACVAGIAWFAFAASVGLSAEARPQALGIFEGQGDVGAQADVAQSLPAGSAVYDVRTGA